MAARDAGGPGPADAGFRLDPHTADELVEAWGPTAEACLAQAVRGLVATFADVGGATPSGQVVLRSTSTGPDLLIEVLEEVIALVDSEGRVPVDVEVRAALDATVVTFHVAALEAVELGSAAPKAVAWSRLHFDRDADGTWRATAIIDV